MKISAAKLTAKQKRETLKAQGGCCEVCKDPLVLKNARIINRDLACPRCFGALTYAPSPEALLRMAVFLQTASPNWRTDGSVMVVAENGSLKLPEDAFKDSVAAMSKAERKAYGLENVL